MGLRGECPGDASDSGDWGFGIGYDPIAGCGGDAGPCGLGLGNPGYSASIGSGLLGDCPASMSTCGLFGDSGPGDYDPMADFASGPFAFLFQGFLYGKYYSGLFGTWNQYASWSTGIAALPESQTYEAFLAIARNLGLDPTTAYTVTSKYGAMVYTVTLPGHVVDRSNLDGMWSDPVTFLHGGNPSWFQGYFWDTPHLIGSDPVSAHVDPFGPLNPLHYLIQIPSMLIPGGPKLTGSCALIGGCMLQ